MTAMWWVRFKPGVAGEARRVVHVVPVPDASGGVPESLMAVCGVQFGPGESDRLDNPDGMPCVGCLLSEPAQHVAAAPGVVPVGLAGGVDCG